MPNRFCAIMGGYHVESYSLRDLYRMGSSSTRRDAPRRSDRRLKQTRYKVRQSDPALNCPPQLSATKTYLTSIPPEIQISIFQNLDSVASTCLGLSSKVLYPFHRRAHPNVGLFETSEYTRKPLCMLLKDWAPQNLNLDWENGEYILSRPSTTTTARSALPKTEDRCYLSTS